MAKITTVIDIGSNSVRMAIFKKTSRFGFALIYELKSKVRISEGSYNANGFLREKPMQRAISALKEFKKIAKIYKSRKIFCIATSAVRDAPNARNFVQRVDKECGIKVKVIDGKKEAFFGSIACANLSHKRDGIMVDIGGGSTECALIKDGKVQDVVSLNIGTIRLKELFFDKKVELKEAKKFVQNALEILPDSFKHQNIFGVGGTIRALAKLIMKQINYPIDLIHGFEIDVQRYIKFIDKIVRAREDKLDDFGIAEERLDNIQGGLLILLMLIKCFGTQTITTCGTGIREGVFLADLLRSHRHIIPNNINPSLQYAMDSFNLDKQCLMIKKIALKLFDLLRMDFNLNDDDRKILRDASLLSQIGTCIDFYHTNKHSAYFAKYVLNYGFSHYQRVIISLLITFSDKKIPKDSDIQTYQGLGLELPTLQILSFILSLAKVLEISYDNSIGISYRQNQLILSGASSNFILMEKVGKLARPKDISIVFE
ncbi:MULTISPECIES: Ppx/GppA phosphatase family protein [unclassified Helicobacter]|uniref:Ppx/GppA phosphatase family protein n=1 Tax=unclassified Helicobacter TaxID=2593540 RepID=UPI000CF05AB1|nr:MULTISPECIES: Ppx/GppA phosphatase family protein [unclassified Helicobacter]